jgi:hypothetical protein
LPVLKRPKHKGGNMKTQTKKEGFAAYEEISAIARAAFPGQEVQVQASIFGNSYEVVAGGRVISGTSETVRRILQGVKP